MDPEEKQRTDVGIYDLIWFFCKVTVSLIPFAAPVLIVSGFFAPSPRRA